MSKEKKISIRITNKTYNQIIDIIKIYNDNDIFNRNISFSNVITALIINKWQYYVDKGIINKNGNIESNEISLPGSTAYTVEQGNEIQDTRPLEEALAELEARKLKRKLEKEQKR